ncbi:hypothetical protein ID866_10299, partial [Astraeus odoratus]
MQVLPLSEEILFWEDGKAIGSPPVGVPQLTIRLARDPGMDIQPYLDTPKPIRLDICQARSLLAGLNQRLSLIQGPPDFDSLLSYIEFEDPDYFEAFQIPTPEDGMSIVGPDNKPVDNTFLISRWTRGEDPWLFQFEPNIEHAVAIWNMDFDARQQKLASWKYGIVKEIVEEVCDAGKSYNGCQDEVNRKFGESLVVQLKTKRIIGCTTTGAAKYTEDLRAVAPDVLLVEEAGEILESHVITALSSSTTQMILIGDHKQLRPKVNNYKLTVEKGDGYDLNRSLFERLVLKGFPHVALSAQHRMRPEVSAFIRALTYPGLTDAPKTQGRENIRGLQKNVVFIDHRKPEDDDKRISDRADGGSPSSKQNSFEVKMVLRIVRFLAQQGYGSDNIVILTPYLGQLSMLRDALKNETDPILNDLDSNDLARAGLLQDANQKNKKTRIRLATIDNYQGEESDIVVASLCRSNTSNAIGFMDSPERLNVLISRARNGLILIGNSSTFEHSKKGGKLWTDFLTLVRNGRYMFKGFPVRCERHPNWTMEIENPDDFDTHSPDGGCTEPCGAMLKCQVHVCDRRCHPIRTAPNNPDVHLTMLCKATFTDKCPCEKEMKLLEKQAKLDLEAKEKREAAEREHDLRMTELEARLQYEMEALGDLQKAKDREDEARQKEKDIEEIKKKVKKAATRAAHDLNKPSSSRSPPSQTPSNPPSRPPTPPQKQPTGQNQSTHQSTGNQSAPRPKSQSAARDKWEYQKRVEGVQSDAIDKIMDMTGLEEVKEQILRIKAKIDTMKRQGVALNKERFNLV